MMANEVRQPCVPACPSQFVAVPAKVFHGSHIWRRSDALEGKKQPSPTDTSHPGTTEDCAIELAALSGPL